MKHTFFCDNLNRSIFALSETQLSDHLKILMAQEKSLGHQNLTLNESTYTCDRCIPSNIQYIFKPSPILREVFTRPKYCNWYISFKVATSSTRFSFFHTVIRQFPWVSFVHFLFPFIEMYRFKNEKERLLTFCRRANFYANGFLKDWILLRFSIPQKLFVASVKKLEFIWKTFHFEMNQMRIHVPNYWIHMNRTWK